MINESELSCQWKILIIHLQTCYSYLSTYWLALKYRLLCWIARFLKSLNQFMGKQKIKYNIFILSLFILANLNTYSQDWVTKELKWSVGNIGHFINSSNRLVFQDKNQIIEWGKKINAFAFVKSEEFEIKDCNIFILFVDICSGISCPNIYVFKKENELWQLKKATRAQLHGRLIIRVDETDEKIIFEMVFTIRKIVSSNEEEKRNARKNFLSIFKKKTVDNNEYTYETTVRKIGKLTFEEIGIMPK